MPAKAKSHSQKYGKSERLPPIGLSSLWDSVSDETLGKIVRSYASMGDAVMFGSSQDRQVASIRVYRAGRPYSVYFRKIGELQSALERLDRFMPSMRPVVTLEAKQLPEVQVQPKRGNTLPSVQDVLNDDSVRLIEDVVERNRAFARKLRGMD